ncbi:MAG TPA: head-tail connector protein [Ruminococcus sp.]|nr:head-tail connector protein [Ruminococcus sp.]
MVTLQEAKNYLRVDHSEDDKLIQDLLLTAKELCMDVGRMDEEELAQNEDTVRTAMLFALGYLYENRNTADMKKLTLSLRSILFAQREGVI